MEDSLRSSLPEELVCHMLSFLPTKHAVATSLLSKEWKSLWRSVPSLDFNDADYGTRCKAAYRRFVQSVNAFIHSRHLHQPIQKFRLRFISHDDPTSINKWVNVAVQHRVQNLDLSIMSHWLLTQSTNLSAIFTCTTLVVLKLQGLSLKPFSSVDLPLLKVLHLQVITLSERGCLAQFLSGCPVLEDFKAKCMYFNNYSTHREFNTLPKLVKAEISMRRTRFLLMEVVNNVQFLRIHEMDFKHHLHDDERTEPYVFPKFYNLTHIELVYRCCANDWLQVVELLKHCPKLRVLVINQPHLLGCKRDGSEEVGDWQYPPSVPESTLCLKRCYLNDYRGTKGEFRFARFIMQNGRSLERMAICCRSKINLQML